MNAKFYMSSSGRSPVEEFLKEQSDVIKSNFVDALSLLAQGYALSMPISRNLSGVFPGLHEMRLKDRHGQVRIFFNAAFCLIVVPSDDLMIFWAKVDKR